ncbi:MAG TPA: hypothetical protein VJ124_00510 [Pyrinomonadaceae bacterium]|nr:hypothetical protein [Pyrinomonadaceae bacterium]
MRTTITLDADVAEKLQAEMRRRRTNNFKKTVNDLLRQGLRSRRELSSIKPFKIRARHMGNRPGLNYDNTGDVLEQLEGVSHR